MWSIAWLPSQNTFFYFMSTVSCHALLGMSLHLSSQSSFCRHWELLLHTLHPETFSLGQTSPVPFNSPPTASAPAPDNLAALHDLCSSLPGFGVPNVPNQTKIDTLICFNSLSIYLAFKCCWLPGRDTCVIAHWNTLTVVHYCFWRDIKRNFGNSLWFKFYLPPITPKLGTVLVQNNLRRFWRQELLNCLLQITVAINAKRNWWISKLKA